MMNPLEIDLAIYRDRVQVSELSSGQFADVRAETPFSTDEALVADVTYFEHALRQGLRKAMAGSAYLLTQPSAHVSSTERPLTPAERTLVRHAFAEAGFGTVTFFDEAGPA